MKLYRLCNGLGNYYVIAPDPTTAENKLMDILNDGQGYGFAKDRKVIDIHLVAEEISVSDKPFHLTGKFLIT